MPATPHDSLRRRPRRARQPATRAAEWSGPCWESSLVKGVDHPARGARFPGASATKPLSLSLLSLVLLAACSADATDGRARTIGSKLCATSIAKDANARALSTDNDVVAIGPALANALAAHSPTFAR